MAQLKDLRRLVIILLLINGAASFAYPNLIPYRKGTKWGFADTSCTVVIKPKYEAVSFFDLRFAKDEMYARVCTNGKWGVIDTTGKLVVPAVYDSIGSFIPDEKVWKNLDLLYVVKDQKIGLISLSGEVKIPFELDLLACFWYAERDVESGTQCLCKKGNEYFRLFQNSLEMQPITEREFQNRSGMEIILIELTEDFENRNLCTDSTEQLHPFQYDSIVDISYFEYTFFKVYSGGKVGLAIDHPLHTNGGWPLLVGLRYDEIHEIQISADVIYLLVSLNGKMGVVDYCGQEIIPIKYDEISNWSPYGAITTLNGKKGAVRNVLRWTNSANAAPVVVRQFEIANSYETIKFVYFPNDADFYLWWVEKDGKEGYVDQLGRAYFK